jgi:hypothetical protein
MYNLGGVASKGTAGRIQPCSRIKWIVEYRHGIAPVFGQARTGNGRIAMAMPPVRLILRRNYAL